MCVFRQTISRFLILLFAGVLLASCSKKNHSQYESLEELNGKPIGIVSGTIYEDISKELFPDSDFYYYKSFPDAISAVTTNKIAAFGHDENRIYESIKQNTPITYIEEPLTSVDIAFIFPRSEKGDRLRGEFNEFIAACKENGQLDALKKEWLNGEGEQNVDFSSLTGENGTLRLATQSAAVPFDYIKDGQWAGFEIELAVEFAKTYHYDLVIDDITFDGLISAIQSGKADFSCSGFGITEERKKSVNFSDPYMDLKGYMIVKSTNETDSSFIDDVRNSFNRTFLVESRWKLFVNGVITTMAITVLSVILGTLLGFAAYVHCRGKNNWFTKFIAFMIWLIQGMPMVVLLMVLYYLIFGGISIDGFYIAVIGFTLTFACSMYGMLQMGENAVDKGQSEAAFTLGYSRNQTFYKIILPQAIRHFMPSYRSAIVALIKSTAIVGYIAVQDITKVGDIIRSRTYEAFFPLIMIAIMYFLMAWILTRIVDILIQRTDYRSRSKAKILKGLVEHD